MRVYTTLLSLLFAACAGTSNVTEPISGPPAGTSWKLVRMHGEPALPSADVTLTFEDDRVVGSAGVNRYFGGWRLEGDTLRISQVGSTRMIGPPDVQQQESRFLAAIEAADGLTIGASGLTLTQSGEVILEFDRIP